MCYSSPACKKERPVISFLFTELVDDTESATYQLGTCAGREPDFSSLSCGSNAASVEEIDVSAQTPAWNTPLFVPASRVNSS